MTTGELELVRQLWIYRNTLLEISRRDPCPADNPNECDFTSVPGGRPCLGCLARIALERATPIGEEVPCKQTLAITN